MEFDNYALSFPIQAGNQRILPSTSRTTSGRRYISRVITCTQFLRFLIVVILVISQSPLSRLNYQGKMKLSNLSKDKYDSTLLFFLKWTVFLQNCVKFNPYIVQCSCNHLKEFQMIINTFLFELHVGRSACSTLLMAPLVSPQR